LLVHSLFTSKCFLNYDFSTKELLGNVITLKRWKLVIDESNEINSDEVYLGITAYISVSLFDVDTTEGHSRCRPNYLFYEDDVVRLIQRIKHYESNRSIINSTNQDKLIYEIKGEEFQNQSFDVRFKKNSLNFSCLLKNLCFNEEI
jgi:hypothetical protein